MPRRPGADALVAFAGLLLLAGAVGRPAQPGLTGRADAATTGVLRGRLDLN